MDLSLQDYGITRDRGFLTPYEMDEITLPDEFSPIIKAGSCLSSYITAGKTKVMLKKLPEVDMAKHADQLNDAQLRLLMVHYSFIVQSFVWGDKEDVPTALPRNLAVPYCILADKIGQYPLLPYTAYTLDNWGKLDKSGPITLENIYVLQNFLGGQDENWFILVHVEIEAHAGTALAAIPPLFEALYHKNYTALERDMTIISNAWSLMNATFNRMPERCDPYIYFNRVRPYIHGWKGNPAFNEGLIYEGVEKYAGKPQAFRGQTGSQSSIVPTMDALLGIVHEDDPLKEFLDELHAYRPPKHRKFIEIVREKSTLRETISQLNNKELTVLYNDMVSQVEAFRTCHLKFAANYINKQARNDKGNPVEIGTGGTPFMQYLKKHRDESGKHLLPVPD